MFTTFPTNHPAVPTRGVNRSRANLARIAAALALGLTLSSAAMADMWRWKDENGQWTYSERRPPGVNAERVTLFGTKSPAPDAMDKLRERGDRSDALREQETSDEEREAAQAENERIAQANCETAKNNLEVLANNKRVEVKDSDGNSIILDEAARQSQIERNQKSVDENCN
ncbi:MAG: DUF4124 domain-containing protein [Gammaproteobacteria bacterium]